MAHLHLAAIQTAIDTTRCAVSASQRVLLLLGPDPQRATLERHLAAVGAIAIGLRLRLTRTRAGRATSLIRPVRHHLHALLQATRVASHARHAGRSTQPDLEEAAARIALALAAWDRLLARQHPAGPIRGVRAPIAAVQPRRPSPTALRMCAK